MEIIYMILGVVGFFVASVWLWEFLNKDEKLVEKNDFDKEMYDSMNDEHFGDMML